MNKLRIGLPKGSLQQSTFEIFNKAGIKIYCDKHSYRPSSNDNELEITLVRAQEIPKYVEQGIFDCGITGYDWILETNSKVKQICELIYSKSGYTPVRWVLAVPSQSKIKSVKELKNKIVATELVNVARKYFNSHNIKCKIQFSWGATEVKVPELADAIIELTETGASLRANNLVIIDEVLVSTTRFIANFKSIKDNWKREKIDNLVILIKGALTAENMVGLKMNIEEKKIMSIIKILPALKKPTISKLSLPGWAALEVILEENKVREIIPKLKKLGAQGIIEYPLNKVIL